MKMVVVVIMRCSVTSRPFTSLGSGNNSIENFSAATIVAGFNFYILIVCADDTLFDVILRHSNSCGRNYTEFSCGLKTLKLNSIANLSYSGKHFLRIFPEVAGLESCC